MFARNFSLWRTFVAMKTWGSYPSRFLFAFYSDVAVSFLTASAAAQPSFLSRPTAQIDSLSHPHPPVGKLITCIAFFPSFAYRRSRHSFQVTALCRVSRILAQSCFLLPANLALWSRAQWRTGMGSFMTQVSKTVPSMEPLLPLAVVLASSKTTCIAS